MRVPKFRVLDRLTGKMLPVGIIDYSIQSVYIEEPNGMYCERDFDEVEFMLEPQLNIGKAVLESMMEIYFRDGAMKGVVIPATFQDKEFEIEVRTK